MAPSPELPYRSMRMRADGSLCIVQAYHGDQVHGGALTMDLAMGALPGALGA